MTRRFTLLVPALAVALLASTGTAAPQYGKPPTPPRTKEPAKQGTKTAPDGEKAPPPAVAPANDKSEAKFYDKLDAADRDALQVNVGYLIPEPTGKLDWIGGDALTLDSFRGKVTVIQSMNSKSGGRGLLEKLKKALPENENLVLIGLHTPENTDKAQATFATNPPCLVAVDSSGDWCDALGVWKRPVNIVVDKTGAVRYVGLSDAGLKAKLEPLLAEEVDDSVTAKKRPGPAKAAESADKPTAWPTFTNEITTASDMRGKTTPGFVVSKWITKKPDPAGRLVAIDFWATWCGPCRASIPHVNELNSKFNSDVLFVGLSSEADKDFTQGLQKYKLTPASFAYSLALDPQQRLDKFFAIKGIPHMAIMSPDGVVRWQGMPLQLTDEDLTKLVAANKALSKVVNKDPAKRGWVSGSSAVAR